MRKIVLATALVATMLAFKVSGARANDAIVFGSGVMKNLYIDVIFWGNNFSDTSGGHDHQDVLNYITNLTSWLNTGWVPGQNGGPPTAPPMGQEPAVHSYGVVGITPGMWMDKKTAIPPQFMSGGAFQLDDPDFSQVVRGAQGSGTAYNFQGTAVSTHGLTASRNRLTIVITKGTNQYCISVGRAVGCLNDNGYHTWASGPPPYPYGAVELESIQPVLSHEIMEAMTDPSPWNGWTTSGVFGSDEAADSCQSQSSGMFASLTVDPFFNVSGSIVAGTSCLATIPEKHAPMDVTLEGQGTAANLVYIDARTNHLFRLIWPAAGQAATGPFDEGQPSPTVAPAGKPSIVFSSDAGGEYVFVKGSDSALWMKWNGVWTPLGGPFLGDPKPVAVSGNTSYVNVIVLGTDDHLWMQSVSNGTGLGWNQIPTGTRLFAGSPTGVSRGPNSMDVFAVGEGGNLNWIPYNPSSGWGSPVTISNGANDPIVAAPSVAVLGGNVMDLFGEGQFDTWWMRWAGTTWSSPQDAAFQLNNLESSYGPEGTPAVVGTIGGIDVFAATRSGNLYWWKSTTTDGFFGGSPFTPKPLVCGTFSAGLCGTPTNTFGNVTGDPVALTRGPNEVEVFYRSSVGSLVHMTTHDRSTWSTENVYQSVLIQ